MIDRRSFIGLGTLTATSLLTGGKITDVLASEAKGASGPTIETNAGKIRGSIEGGVNCFKGVHYGRSAAGARRFMPPEKPQP